MMASYADELVRNFAALPKNIQKTVFEINGPNGRYRVFFPRGFPEKPPEITMGSDKRPLPIHWPERTLTQCVQDCFDQAPPPSYDAVSRYDSRSSSVPGPYGPSTGGATQSSSSLWGQGRPSLPTSSSYSVYGGGPAPSAPPAKPGFFGGLFKKKDKEKKVKAADPQISSNRSESGSSDDLREEIERLRQEKEQLESSNTCSICMDHDIDSVLMDCGHQCCCTKCGKKLKKCPICRATVRKVVKTYHI